MADEMTANISPRNQIVIVHCSDLHFGEVPANNIFHSSWPRREQNAHDLKLCMGLEVAMEDVRDLTDLADDEPIRFVMSGDLTLAGSDKEFLVGQSFLRSLFQLRRYPVTDTVGFNVRGSVVPEELPLRAVPGNHDHWCGSRWMWGNNPNIRNSQFRKTSWVIPWRQDALMLEVCGLDSCAGVSPRVRNKRQIGMLDLSQNGEVEVLRAELQIRDQQALPDGVRFRIRALVVHHSLAYAGGFRGALKLDDASKKVLLELAEEFKISAFLTGHTHDFFFDPSFDTLPNGSHKVYELRSASTLQGPATRKSPEPPGFWVHRIQVIDNSVQWSSWRYYWDGASAFLPKNRSTPCVQF